MSSVGAEDAVPPDDVHEVTGILVLHPSTGAGRYLGSLLPGIVDGHLNWKFRPLETAKGPGPPAFSAKA